MKMLYVANDRIPTDRASGLQIMKTCEALARRGLEIELLIPNRKTHRMSDDPFEYYRTLHNFSLKRLWCLDLIPYLGFFGPLAYWLIFATYSFSVILYSSFHFYDYLYFRSDTWLFWSLIFVRRRLIGEFHFLPSPAMRRWLHWLSLVVVVNETLRVILSEDKRLAGKISLAPDGVAVKDFDINFSSAEARKKLNLPEKKRIVLYTGHFYQWKGIDALIKTADLLPSDTVLVLAGGDTPEDTPLLKGLISTRIIMTGFKKYAEIPLYLKAAECVVVTGTKKDDRSFFFTSPLKLFEYMASRRPIVASDTRAIREVLTGGRNALLISPDDPAALAFGIQKMLDDRNLAEKLSEQARIDVEEFTWEKRAQKILGRLKEVRGPLKMLYIFAGSRGNFYESFRKGSVPDTQLLGLNHMEKFGIRAEFRELHIAQFLRRISFNLVHLPYIFFIRSYDVVFLGAGIPFIFFVRRILWWKRPYFVIYNTYFINALKRNPSGAKGFIVRKAIAGIEGIICTGRFQEEFLLERGFDPKKVFFRHIGIDAQAFVAATKMYENTKPSYIISVGRDLGRDFDTLIEAARDLAVEVRIVTARRNVSHIKNIPANVRFYFDLPYEKMPEMYQGAFFAVTTLKSQDDPSGSDTSGQYGFLEPMASGKAVIATRRPTVADYIEDGVDGLLVEPANPKELRMAMERLLSNQELRARLGSAAQKKVQENFTSERFARSIAEISSELVFGKL